MPYAPGVTDISGQLFAQGLQQGISSLAQGLERNFQERKKKEEEKRAKEAVMQAGKGLFGDAFDLKDAPQDQWGQIIQLNQHKQQLPMLALQQENAKLRNQIDLGQINAMAQTAAQQQRNAAALAQAFNPTADTAAAIQGGAGFENLPTAPASDPMAVVMRAGKGGADAATLAHLAAMSENLAQSQQRMTAKAERMPMEMTFGGVPAVVANGNVQFIPNHAPKPEFPRVIDINGTAHTQISPTQFVRPDGSLLNAPAEKPLTAQSLSAAMMGAGQIQDTANWLKQNPKAGTFQRQTTYDADVLRRKATANAAAMVMGETPPYPEALREKSAKRLTGQPRPQTSTAPAVPTTAPAKAGQFEEGQVYTDKNGNRARYVNGQWQPL